ncbi:cation transporter [Gallaecimonas kandeliae]|uniref:cation transporter n=1 Tax=Gallaecimonas kandeliae TaxID=3029055 RepID=UPI00264859FE|nr:cation transporter [Gallaecimonas kandeliae]WKE66495.1 cation transporter [Gallaecimonas kandeliae]
MSDLEHRPGVRELNLVVRHLKLDAPDAQKVAQAMAEIDPLLGMDGVSFDDRAQVLSLAYDATRLDLDKLEALLKEHGLTVSHDWWTHLKESYYRFVDQNIKDNDQHDPWSCH